jgi:hypothetical protein
LVINASSTLTSNGKTFNSTLSFNSPSTITLADNWNVLNVMVGPFTVTTNNNSISISGNLTLNNNNTTFQLGTSTFIMNGTGTWSGVGVIRNNLTINTSGTITISGIVSYNTGTLTYVAGTVVTTGSTLQTGTIGTTTLNTNGINWNNIYMGGSSNIVVLTSDLTTVNFITTSVAINTTTGKYFYISGNYSNNSISGVVFGTSKLILNGTGTWGGSGTQSTIINVDINTTGTITLGSTIYYSIGTIKYIAGTVVTTGSTLTLTNSCTLDTNGITWNNVLLYNTAITVTNISNLNTFNLYLGQGGQSGSITFNGSPIYVTGSIIYLTGGNSFLGTTSIYAIGTGSINNGGGGGGIRLCVPIIINTTGTYTNNLIYLGTGASLTYIAGTIAGTNQVYIYANMNIDTNVMPITYLFIDVASTLTLNSDLNVVGTTYFNFPSTSFSLNGFITHYFNTVKIML